MLKEIVLQRKTAAFTVRLFEDCVLLKRLVISPCLRSIGAEAFADSELVKMDLRDVTTFSVACVENCATLQTVVPSRDAAVFPDRMFKNCWSLRPLVILPRVRTIGVEAFACAGVVEANLEYAKVLGEACFADSGLERVKFGNELAVLPKRAIASTPLRMVATGRDWADRRWGFRKLDLDADQVWTESRGDRGVGIYKARPHGGATYALGQRARNEHLRGLRTAEASGVWGGRTSGS
jgi:hypothetical protein